jgi:error-prone DNA polymerase
MNYVELQVTSNFTFLRGASHPHELMEEAARLGYREIAITDRNTLAGVVRAHIAAKENGIRLITGCRLDLQDGASLLAYPANKKAYEQLSALLTVGNLRTEKGKCLLYKKDLYDYANGIKFIVVPPQSLRPDFHFDNRFSKDIQEYSDVFGNDLYLGVSRNYLGDDMKKLFRLSELGKRFNKPLVAVNNVLYHSQTRRQLQDVVTCIREKCTIQTAGFRLQQNAERYLKPPVEMLRLFRQYPDAILRTQEIAEACSFTLDSLQYEYPEELTSEGRTPQEELTYLAWRGAEERFPNGIPEQIVHNIRHELTFIEKMNYASYFLTVYDIVRYARSQGILCQGRGSAANSTVCYCIGVTSVDPSKFQLLFERFASEARNEPPDIDLDLEHERREEVMQYIYNRYGRERAAIVATVTQQHHKGAVRDVAKAMGLSLDTVNRLSKAVWEFTEERFNKQHIIDIGLNPDDAHLKKVIQLTNQFIGFPRQLGQHTGGFVIARDKLFHLCPILHARTQNRTNIEWNKDDIDALGLMKVDVLALGMLTCIKKAFDLAKQHYNLHLTLANIPQDDPAVYDMVSAADTIGLFQIESRAQQAMLPRMKPKCFYDLVIEVALVRPGPIVGGMVHPYLRRRNGEEPVDYPSKELEETLSRTLGVVLFQEQVMKIAIVAAGFTAAEADQLRRNMATFKLNGTVSKFKEKFLNGMVSRGYKPEYADRVFKQIEGFGAYGFPEAHAASFALIVYVSAWLKCYYPEIFACALLNSQPMGFYAPAQIIQDARNHSVEVLPIDVNYSGWDNTLEKIAGNRRALRLGYRQINGIRTNDTMPLEKDRVLPFKTINDVFDAGVSKAALEKLADADAFRSLGIDRRQALWQVTALADHPTGLFTGQPSESARENVKLPEMTASEHVVQDYAATSLSLKAHPLTFLREKLSLLNIVTAQQLSTIADGAPVKVAGLVLVRQRPSTSKGVLFMTLEDETGTINLVVFNNLFEKRRKEIMHSKLIQVEGRLQRQGEVIHVILEDCHDFTKLLSHLTRSNETDIPLLTLSRPDEKNTAPIPIKARDFK